MYYTVELLLTFVEHCNVCITTYIFVYGKPGHYVL